LAYWIENGKIKVMLKLFPEQNKNTVQDSAQKIDQTIQHLKKKTLIRIR